MSRANRFLSGKALSITSRCGRNHSNNCSASNASPASAVCVSDSRRCRLVCALYALVPVLPVLSRLAASAALSHSMGRIWGRAFDWCGLAGSAVASIPDSRNTAAASVLRPAVESAMMVRGPKVVVGVLAAARDESCGLSVDVGAGGEAVFLLGSAAKAAGRLAGFVVEAGSAECWQANAKRMLRQRCKKIGSAMHATSKCVLCDADPCPSAQLYETCLYD